MPLDKSSLARLLLLHPDLRVEVIQIFCDIDEALTGRARCRFTSTLRTYGEQDALYAQGRTKPGPIVTNARGGQSYHNFGFAIDFCLLYDSTGTGVYDKVLWNIAGDYDADKVADWMEVIRIFKAYGWESGGDWTFKDWPHVQKVGGRTWQQLAELVAQKKVAPAQAQLYIKL